MDVSDIKQLPLPNGFSASLDQTHGKKDLGELETLVFGFLREIETTSTHPMSTDVKCICVEYSVEKHSTFFAIYDASVSSIEMSDDSHYQILKGLQKGRPYVRGDIIFLSPIQLNEGVHFVTVKCVTGHPNDKFGVVENADLEELEEFGKIYLYDKEFKSKFYWWRHTNQIWTERFRTDEDHTSQNYPTKEDKQWGHGDVLKLRIDCEQWKVEFFCNDESVCEVNLEPDKAYFAALTNGAKKCEYHHLLDAQEPQKE